MPITFGIELGIAVDRIEGSLVLRSFAKPIRVPIVLVFEELDVGGDWAPILDIFFSEFDLVLSIVFCIARIL